MWQICVEASVVVHWCPTGWQRNRLNRLRWLRITQLCGMQGLWNTVCVDTAQAIYNSSSSSRGSVILSSLQGWSTHTWNDQYDACYYTDCLTIWIKQKSCFVFAQMVALAGGAAFFYFPILLLLLKTKIRFFFFILHKLLKSQSLCRDMQLWNLPKKGRAERMKHVQCVITWASLR